ncbi:hypothetical protein STEG23_009682 [Scotinomys teguina]
MLSPGDVSSQIICEVAHVTLQEGPLCGTAKLSDTIRGQEKSSTRDIAVLRYNVYMMKGVLNERGSDYKKLFQSVWNLPSSAFCEAGFVDRLGLFMVSQISCTFCVMTFLDLVFSLTDESSYSGVLEEASPAKPMGVKEEETKRIKKRQSHLSLSRSTLLTGGGWVYKQAAGSQLLSDPFDIVKGLLLLITPDKGRVSLS